jgi:hypothetical protein
MLTPLAHVYYEVMEKNELQRLKRDRERYVSTIATSADPKRLIVAGPGTGKTYLFKTLLRKVKKDADQEGLALTFIRNLVSDLERDLAGLARVCTFHAFCKGCLHSVCSDGREYYPSLSNIVARDLGILGVSLADPGRIDGDFFGLKSSELVKSALRLGDYYSACGHTDGVYRVIRYLETHPSQIPTYPLIVVDEYQDFNLMEISLIGILSRRSPILIVGDDDQALYSFKHASPKYIRMLIQDSSFRKFELPYCSRCTKVMVDAVNQVVRTAIATNKLVGRVPKRFSYFPPDKEEDSSMNPRIIDVRCSVEKSGCHYMGKFIAGEIRNIPRECIRASHRLGEPTALIIGPGHFLQGVRTELRNSQMLEDEEETAPEGGVDIIDGYKILGRNPCSRLGWRIVMYCDPCSNAEEILKHALSEEVELEPRIRSARYKSRHLELARLITRIADGEKLKARETKVIEKALNMNPEEIRRCLLILDHEDGSPVSPGSDGNCSAPRVMCVTFERSKGLAAQYAFVVGMNDGHFPQKPGSISDRDICKLIVALTRARKKCYVLSCDYYAGKRLRPSIFLRWLQGMLSAQIYVNKEYIERYCS